MIKSKNKFFLISLITLIGLLTFIVVFRTSTTNVYAEINDESGVVFYTNNTEVSIPIKNIKSDMFAVIARIDEEGCLQKNETVFVSSGSENMIMHIDALSEKERYDFYVTFIETYIGQDFVLPENIKADDDTVYVSCDTGDYKFRKISVILDQTAPIIESVSESNNEDGTITLNVIASDDNGSGVYLYCFDNEDWLKENYKRFDTNREVQITVKDKVGNVSLPYKYTIKSIDKESPVIEDAKVVGVKEYELGFDGKEYYQSAKIEIKARDDITPSDELLFSVNGSEYKYHNPITINMNGEYRIVAKDHSGKISEEEYVIAENINKAPEVKNVTINSALKDKFCTNAETIIVSFEISNYGAAYADECIKVYLGEQELTEINSVEKGKYTVVIDNKDKTFYNEELLIYVTDFFNQKSNESKKYIFFDSIKPEINDDIEPLLEGWSNSDITYTINVTEEESGLDENSLNIKSGGEYVEKVLFDSNQNAFDINVDVNNQEYADFKLNFTVTDLAGNESDEKTIDVKIDKKPPVINDIIYSVFDEDNKEIDKKYVKNGDKLQITIEASDEGSGLKNSEMTVYMDDEGKIPIQLKVMSCTKNKVVWSESFEIDDSVIEWLKDNHQVEIKKFSLQDQAGNIENVDGSNSDITYYAPFKFENMKFQYCSADEADENDMLVIDGDIIEIKFISSHEVTINSGIGFDNFNGQINWQHELNSENNYVYRGSYEVSNSPENDNSYFKIFIKITDDAGNYLEPDIDSEIGKILYYTPIADSFSGLKITSDNDTNKEYAKNEDTVTVTFETSHPVNVENAKIADKDVVFFSEDSMNWSASLQIHNEDISDNTDIEFTFDLTDSAGNEIFSRNQDDTEKIRYLAPIEVNELTISSDNEKAEFKGAKNGDVITISFETKHPVNLTDTQIAGREIEFISEDNINWIAQIIAENGIAEDMGYISFNFNVHDNAGNEVVQQTENNLLSEKVQYYAPINISDVEIYSSNANDGNKYAKDGDIITVSFTSNHDIEISSASVNGNTPEVSVYSTDSENRRYELLYTLENGDAVDQSLILFSFTANDFAENEPVTITNESVEGINEVIYYAPIISDSSIRSWNRNQLYVNNGGKITVSGTANHSVTPESAVIMGRVADVFGRNTTDFSINYTIDDKESSLSEENATFSYTLVDPAGNTLYVDSVSDGSSVVYDRTLPTITVEYDKVSFTNKSVTYKFTFFDKHISPNDISIKVNGIEQITDNERSAISGTVFTKEITLDTDNNYHVTASSKDLANNSAYPKFEMRMTIDKTNPKVRTLNISTDSPEIYRSSFSIRDHFEIDDKNLKEVICTVTNSSGTVDWDINTPVMSDGKNTVYLMATDMSDNVSQAVIYDFYIDGTAPKPLVSEILSGIFMEQGENYSFSLEANLKISLEALHIEGISEPDKFTKLYITDKNGNKIADLLEEYASESGIYTISLKDIGEYILYAEAKDSVENTIGLIEYHFEIKEKSLTERFWDNKPLVAATAAGVCVIIFAVVYVLLFKRVKKK